MQAKSSAARAHPWQPAAAALLAVGRWAGYGLAVDGMQLLGLADSDFDLVGVACWADGNDLQVGTLGGGGRR